METTQGPYTWPLPSLKRREPMYHNGTNYEQLPTRWNRFNLKIWEMGGGTIIGTPSCGTSCKGPKVSRSCSQDLPQVEGLGHLRNEIVQKH